jgi:hypothetical protein
MKDIARAVRLFVPGRTAGSRTMLVAAPDKDAEARVRVARAGLERIGFLVPTVD